MPRRSAHPKDKGWKAQQSRLKIKRKTKLAALVLAAVLALIILGQLVSFTKTLNSPWNLTGVKRPISWDNNFNINLVVKTNTISILSFDPQEKKIALVSLPETVFLEVPQGLGSWQLRSVYDLGGRDLLKDSLSSFLGIPIDGFIEGSGPLKEKKAEEVVDLMRQNPTNIFSLLPNLKTDLTLWDLLSLKWEFLGVRFDKIQTYDLVKLNILQDSKLSDGSEVLTADPIRLDAVLIQLADPKLRSEHLNIAVFNATSYPNLAQKAARMITNLGGNVIITTNSTSYADKTTVEGIPSKTLRRLSQIFACCDKITSTNLKEESRAQINVIVGEDFYLRFGNK